MKREIQLAAFVCAMEINEAMKAKKLSRANICAEIGIHPTHGCRAMRSPTTIEHLVVMAEIAARCGMKLELTLRPMESK